jgi:RHS repeat-associated protein
MYRFSHLWTKMLHGLIVIVFVSSTFAPAFPAAGQATFTQPIEGIISPPETASVPILAEEVAKQADPPDTPPIRLNVTANPQLIIPDVPISVEWEVDQRHIAEKMTDAKMVVQFPNDVRTTETAALTRGDYKTSMEFPLSASADKANFIVDSKTEKPFLIDVTMISGEEEVVGNSVLLTEPSFQAIAGRANHLISDDKKVELNFPEKALAESIYLDVRDPSPSSITGYSLSGNPVEVVAVGVKSRQNVYQFENDFSISIHYDPERIFGWHEEDLSIYYYDEDSDDWWALATEVDPKNNTLTAQVNHLTVFDYGANSWQASRLPTVDAADVSGYTGAATYGMSFWLPPAPGGFGPSLSLSYNSQVIDGSTAFTQAGWVGMGWSLDTGYIERDMHGTNDNTTDDTFMLTLGGVSSRLLPIDVSGDVITYATQEMNYWTIEQDTHAANNKWTVKDQAGNTHVFGHATKTASAACTGTLNLTWRWSLTSSTDRFGNTITYNYTNQAKSDSCANQVAVYPESIVYPNGLYRVSFIREGRSDYQSAWEGTNSKVFFQKFRLNKILVEHRTSTANPWFAIRQYDFIYSNTSTNQIYPAFTWTKGGKTTTLTGVQELSGDGATALPATQFNYSVDKMHLDTVDNGQGGSVTFAYERMTYLDDENVNTELRSLYTEFGVGTHECAAGYGTAWYAMTGKGTTKCEQYMLQIDKKTADIGVGLRAFPQHIIKPGGHYRLAIWVRNIYATTGIEWGFTDPNNNRDVQGIANGIGSTIVGFEVGKDMAVNTDPLTTKLIIECDNCYVKKLQFMLMPLYYRVTSKTVTDTATSPHTTGTYTYSYNGPAANSKIHSVAASRTGTKYTPVMREYRGYATVQVKDPIGQVMTTWYHQGDLLKGRPYRTLNSTQDVVDSFDTMDTAKWSFSHRTGTTPRQTIEAGFGGERWLKSSTSTSNWSTVTNRQSYSLTDGDMMYTQFQIQGNNTQTQLGVETSTGQYFGLYAAPSGSSHNLYMRVKTGANPDDTLLMPAATFKRDTWYMLMIFVDDDDGFQIRVWEKGKPENYPQLSSGSLSKSVAWRFTKKVISGTVLLDTYMEGRPYAETEITYATNILYDTLTNDIPNLAGSGLLGFVDLQVNWSTTSSITARLFDGDYAWTGTRTTFEYHEADQGGQYGNLTRTIQAYWDGSNWENYRATLTKFVPNAGAALTTLPARQVTLDCATGCDFDGENGKVAETIYLYDDSESVQQPAQGKLTAVRKWVNDGQYSQVTFAYDAYGNQTELTSYSGYASATASPTSGARTSTTAYDQDGYHTYAISSSNALGQTTAMAYNYSLGVPVSVTDPNGSITAAAYDPFGRMIKVAAPGDELQTPTLAITYYDTRIPFQVGLEQTIDEETSLTIHHFYSGLGQLIQSQTVGAVVDGQPKNIVVDTQYDVLGRQMKATVPSARAYNAAPTFLSQNFSQLVTVNAYLDTFGRLSESALPNGNTTRYAYNGLTTLVTDPDDNTRTEVQDVWGRVVSVSSPESPGLSYTYDTLDRLVRAVKGSGEAATTTEIAYNRAGQKISMTDPDMGHWTYQYDGLGNLTSQTDARECTSNLAYDVLNRPTQKSYSGSGACGQTASVSFYYDQQTFTFLGSTYGNQENSKGRMAGMVDGSGATVWSYDSRGRKLSETKMIYANAAKTQSEDFTTTWAYNNADMAVSTTYPDGEVVDMAYNAQGMLTGMASTDNTYIKSISYDAAGRMQTMLLGNDASNNAVITRNYSYHDWGEPVQGGLLSSLETTRSVGGNLQELLYNYDENGNVTRIKDEKNNENATFTYDALNRITAMAIGGVSVEAFGYDGQGRMDSKQSNGQTLTLDYEGGAPHAVTRYGNQTMGYNEYEYDANGNQVERNLTNGNYMLVYDAENRLVEVSSDHVVPTVTPTATGTVQSPTPTVTPTVTPTPSANMIPNGDFENGIASWQQLTLGHLTDDSHSGDVAVRITDPAGVYAESNFISVTPGQPYLLTAWFRWDKLVGNNWGHTRIFVYNNNWSKAGEIKHFEQTCPRYEWCQVSMTFTPSGNSVRVDFGLFGPQDEYDLFYDDFYLTEASVGMTETHKLASEIRQADMLVALNTSSTGALWFSSITEGVGRFVEQIFSFFQQIAAPFIQLFSRDARAHPAAASFYDPPNDIFDDFEGSSLSPEWTFVDPLGDSNYSLTANPGHLQISLPQGSTHECWGSTINCVRMIRPVSNADATYEVKIDGNLISASQQMYGISLFEDAQKLYRFEFSSYNGVVSIRARMVTPGYSATLINGPNVTLTGEDYLRVTKELFRYTLEYKLGSGEWTEAGSFIRSDIAVNYAGMHVLNKDTNPATTANFDYFGVTYIPMPGIVSLLPNGDFEYGLMGWDQFTPQHLTGEAVSGDYAVHITDQNLVMGINGWFSLEQGQEYTLSFWFRWDHHTSNQWGSPRIQVVNDQWGTEVRNLQSLYGLCPQYEWCHMGMNFVASRERVRLEVGHAGPEDEVDIYFDGIAIDKVGGQGEPTVTPTATQTVTPTVTQTQSTTTMTPTAAQTATPTQTITPTVTTTTAVTATVTATPTVTATQPPTQPASLVRYTYDGSGSLVKSEVDGVITFYPGRHYHKIVDEENVTVKKYYAIGMTQIAVRTIEGASDTLNWILTDHLSSASVIANADGTFLSEVKYTAFGEIRSGSEDMPTNYKYTGQLSQMAEVGLYHYGARFYDPVIFHFISADTMVPSAGNAMDWNRYAYVRYNPINLIDPSGNRACSSDGNGLEDCEEDSIDKLIREYNLKAKYIWQPLPGVEEIGVTDDAPPKFDTMDINRRSIHYYERLRARLYISGHTDAFDETGKIHDVILISYLISGEFGDYKFYPPEDIKAALVYDAGISAISNQYFSTKTIFNGGARCKGNCTVLSQLQWVQGIEAWRNENRYNLSVKRWSEFHDDALRISLSPYKSFSTFGNPQDPSWFNRTPIFCYPLHNFCVK